MSDTEKPRRFPAPWTVEPVSDEGLAVVDANGMRLAYVHFEHDPGRRFQMRRLSPDEARRIAANIAKLPELLGAVVVKDDAPDLTTPEWSGKFGVTPVRRGKG